jgi:hypothetical protein
LIVSQQATLHERRAAPARSRGAVDKNRRVEQGDRLPPLPSSAERDGCAAKLALDPHEGLVPGLVEAISARGPEVDWRRTAEVVGEAGALFRKEE